MNYLFEGTTLKLVKYEIKYPYSASDVMTTELSSENDENSLSSENKEVNAEVDIQKNLPENSDENYNIMLITSEEEKDAILKAHPDAIVTEVDNSGYEWLDGRNFEESEKTAGLVEKAIELGQEAFEQYLVNTDPNAQMLEVMYRITLLEMGVNIDDLSVD